MWVDNPDCYVCGSEKNGGLFHGRNDVLTATCSVECCNQWRKFLADAVACWDYIRSDAGWCGHTEAAELTLERMDSPMVDQLVKLHGYLQVRNTLANFVY